MFETYFFAKVKKVKGAKNKAPLLQLGNGTRDSFCGLWPPLVAILILTF